MNKIQQRITGLREQMQKAGVQACYISGTDPHQSEYVPDRWQSRSFISGFTGSAGLVVITLKAAALWTDSRYFLQAESELEGTGIQLMRMRVEGTPGPAQWLGHLLEPGDKLGVDESCLSMEQFKNLESDLAVSKIEVQPVGDLLDAVWNNRPGLPVKPVYEHEIQFAGKSRYKKLEEIRQEMHRHKADYILLTALDDIAWTFNLRGSDVDYNPVFLSYAVIGKEKSWLFIDSQKLDKDLMLKLSQEDIDIRAYSGITKFLNELQGSFLIDSSKTNQQLLNSLNASVNIIYQQSIPTELKALKTKEEINCFQNVMRKDGVAMVEFLYWLNQIIGKEKITEYDIALKLNEFRAKQEHFKGASFHPIIGYQDHGAIVHFKVTKETANEIEPEGFLLFDSGGQYLDGTTDITRTVALGEPTSVEKKDYTLVLKGMINLTMVRFPVNTQGCNLDIIARKALWDNGLNYGHGTCHGIGYFLNVHEGPMSIRQEYNEHTIKPGMVMSNEPAFYREGKYGIRTENVIVCVEKEDHGYGRFLGFDTLTLCPIDKKAIDINLFDQKEIDWLNDYHQWVFDELSPFLDNEKVDFLRELTTAI